MEKTGMICSGCQRDILKKQINDLLVDNRGVWHTKCFIPEPITNEAAKGVSLAA